MPEETPPVCGYKGDPVCFPPDCSGACPPDGIDLRPEKERRCRWFAKCTETTTNQVKHPTLGWVDTCDKHIAWLGDNPSPTQFIPPLAASVLDRNLEIAPMILGGNDD